VVPDCGAATSVARHSAIRSGLIAKGERATVLQATVVGNRHRAWTNDEGVISLGEIRYQKPPSPDAVEVSGALRCDGGGWQNFLIAKRQVVQMETRRCQWGVICHVPYCWSLTPKAVEDMLSMCLGVEHWINGGLLISCAMTSL
jgi:hypothetical protein